nr:unnamed protein product [Haemonchus contortus]
MQVVGLRWAGATFNKQSCSGSARIVHSGQLDCLDSFRFVGCSSSIDTGNLLFLSVFALTAVNSLKLLL